MLAQEQSRTGRRRKRDEGGWYSSSPYYQIERARRGAGYKPAEWQALTWQERSAEVAWWRLEQTIEQWHDRQARISAERAQRRGRGRKR